MIKKTFILLAAVVVVVIAGSYLLFSKRKLAEQPPEKVWRIGILSGVEGFYPIAEGFKAKMTELGYIEGRNVSYDTARLNADPAGNARVGKEFVDKKVDLIFAFPTEPAIDARLAAETSAIPVVFALGSTENVPLVQSVREPGWNITGVRYPNPELTLRRFDNLHALKPGLKRLLIAYNPSYPAVVSALEVLHEVAPKAGVTLVEVLVNDPDELKVELAKLAKSKPGVDAVLIMPETVVQSPNGWALMSAFAAEQGIPIGGSAAFQADAGAVFSDIPDNLVMGGMAATLADKILRGEKAGTIPIATPESRLRFNYTLAQKLKLTVTEEFLSGVDEIIR